jgi:hypothetical protein
VPNVVHLTRKPACSGGASPENPFAHGQSEASLHSALILMEVPLPVGTEVRLAIAPCPDMPCHALACFVMHCHVMIWSTFPFLGTCKGLYKRLCWLVGLPIGLSPYHFECIFPYSEIRCLLSLEQRYLVVKFRSSNNKRAILLLI